MNSLTFFSLENNNNIFVNKKKKKNGAHTHVCTTVQLGEHNIHVGCCLFSHIPRPTKKHNNSIGLKTDAKLYVLEVNWVN